MVECLRWRALLEWFPLALQRWGLAISFPVARDQGHFDNEMQCLQKRVLCERDESTLRLPLPYLQ